MSESGRRDFDIAAASWDEKPQRRLIADAVISGIKQNVPLNPDMQVLEFGCGTGLCGLQLAPKIGNLMAADTSKGMLEELCRKSSTAGLKNVSPFLLSEDTWTLPASAFDLIFSSMVLHHIEEIQTLLENLNRSIKPGGYVALADLEEEDGTFHDDPNGVHHFGFNPKELTNSLKRMGFVSLKTITVHTVLKNRGDEEKSYPVFLITGRKPC